MKEFQDNEGSLMARLSAQEDKIFERATQQIRRGDGIADFLQVKSAFYKCREEVTDQESRIKSLEELFHKQTIIQSSNEIVTTQSLNNYLDALTKHIERQFQERVATSSERARELMIEQMGEVERLIKGKASKQQMDRKITHVTELITNTSMRLETIFAGLEMSIAKGSKDRVEIADLEALEKSKADVGEINRLEEKVDRLEQLIEDRLQQMERMRLERPDRESHYSDEEQSEEEDEDEDIDDFQNIESEQEDDPEELKDQINEADLAPSRLEAPEFPKPLNLSSISAAEPNADAGKESQSHRSVTGVIGGEPETNRSNDELKNNSVQQPMKRMKSKLRADSVTDQMSIASSRRDTRSKHSKSKLSRRDSVSHKSALIKNQLPRKMENIIEIENIKKEIAENSQKLKEFQEAIEAQIKPSIDFFKDNEEILKQTINEYKASLKRISEMETYDDSLRHKYLKTALQQVNDVKAGILSEMNQFKVKQKEERENFLVRIKTVETDVEYSKLNIEYLRKIVQQHKFFGGCYANPVMPGGSTIQPATTVEGSVEDKSTILITQEVFKDSVICGGSCAIEKSNGGFGSASLMQPTLPVQLTHINSRLAQLQSDLEEQSKATKEKLAKVAQEIDEMRNPLSQSVQNLKKEKEAISRELDRFKTLYKQVFEEYVSALDENKTLLERLEGIEKRLAGSSNYINNATIQFINSAGDSTSARPNFANTVSLQPSVSVTPSARAVTAQDTQQFALDSKAFAQCNVWKRKQNQFETAGEPPLSKIDNLAVKVAQAKRKLRGLSQTPKMNNDLQEKLGSIHVQKIKPQQQGDNQERAKTSLADKRNAKGKAQSIEVKNVDSESNTPARKQSSIEIENPSTHRKKIELTSYLDRHQVSLQTSTLKDERHAKDSISSTPQQERRAFGTAGLSTVWAKPNEEEERQRRMQEFDQGRLYLKRFKNINF